MRAVLVTLAACGRIGFDASDAVDARDVGTGPWSSPTLAFVGDPMLQYDDPSLASGGLELYVNESDGVGFGHVAVLRRASVGDPWGPITLVAELPAGISQPETAGDNVMYMSDQMGMLVSTRGASRVWSAPARAPDLDGAGVYDVSAGPAGHEAVVTYGGATMGDLALVRRSGTDQPWGSREPIIAVNVASATDAEGCLAEYGKALYLGSSRDDFNRDLYRAARTAIDQPFGPAERILELSSPSEDSDPWVSADGHTMFFTSQRGGLRQIWTSTR